LPFRLLIDECLASRELIGRARKAGHDVVSSRDVLGDGTSDDDVMAYARRERRSVITANCGDFLSLHAANGEHHGVLLVFEDADRRDMSPRDVVRALELVLIRYSGSIANELIVLNHFRG
jgi:predicted nuclease of predicted toxin-antitoxin system